MTRIALGPTSQKTVEDDVFVRTAELARQYKGVRLHTHMAENQVQNCSSVTGHSSAEWPSNKNL